MCASRPRLVSDITYEATWRLWSELLPQRYGIEATFVDITDHDAVRAAIRPNTRLVCVEAIANPTTQVTDVAAIAAIAHERGALLMVDSTYTPPPVYRPLQAGADLVVHSLTKYINGHGDAMGGAVVGRRELIEPIKADAMVDVGGIISPFNAWQIQRGSVTLPLRMRQHLASAQAIAEFLEADPRVAYIYYPPGLPLAPAARARRPPVPARIRRHDGLRRRRRPPLGAEPVRGESAPDHLGLLTRSRRLPHRAHRHRGGRVAAYPEPFRRMGHLRLSVGLEDTADLLADMQRPRRGLRLSTRLGRDGAPVPAESFVSTLPPRKRVIGQNVWMGC